MVESGMKTFWRAFILWVAMAGTAAHAIVPVGVQPLGVTVDGVQRTALVYVPKIEPGKTVPLVFVFHGHGGGSRAALGGFGLDRRWPEAISVYPQGVPIPSITDAEGKRTGWQHTLGDVGDRDLHFFDALLERLKKDYPVDASRIYCTGHSNGGGFTYLLWLARPTVFAAVAPCSSAAKFSPELTPKPALISGGKNDPLVKFEYQQMELDALQKVNGCEATGLPWADGKGTLYPSKGGTPLVTFFYDGEHAMVPGEAELIVKFFQEHPGAERKP